MTIPLFFILPLKDRKTGVNTPWKVSAACASHRIASLTDGCCSENDKHKSDTKRDVVVLLSHIAALFDSVSVLVDTMPSYVRSTLRHFQEDELTGRQRESDSSHLIQDWTTQYCSILLRLFVLWLGLRLQKVSCKICHLSETGHQLDSYHLQLRAMRVTTSI
jgi:hypothetical protein